MEELSEFIQKSAKSLNISYTFMSNMTSCKLKKWGNSLGILIPAQDVKAMGLKKGETIILDIKKKKRIDAFGIFKGAKSFRRTDRLDREYRS